MIPSLLSVQFDMTDDPEDSVTAGGLRGRGSRGNGRRGRRPPLLNFPPGRGGPGGVGRPPPRGARGLHFGTARRSTYGGPGRPFNGVPGMYVFRGRGRATFNKYNSCDPRRYPSAVDNRFRNRGSGPPNYRGGYPGMPEQRSAKSPNYNTSQHISDSISGYDDTFSDYYGYDFNQTEHDCEESLQNTRGPRQAHAKKQDLVKKSEPVHRTITNNARIKTRRSNEKVTIPKLKPNSNDDIDDDLVKTHIPMAKKFPASNDQKNDSMVDLKASESSSASDSENNSMGEGSKSRSRHKIRTRTKNASRSSSETRSQNRGRSASSETNRRQNRSRSSSRASSRSERSDSSEANSKKIENDRKRSRRKNNQSERNSVKKTQSVTKSDRKRRSTEQVKQEKRRHKNILRRTSREGKNNKIITAVSRKNRHRSTSNSETTQSDSRNSWSNADSRSSSRSYSKEHRRGDVKKITSGIRYRTDKNDDSESNDSQSEPERRSVRQRGSTAGLAKHKTSHSTRRKVERRNHFKTSTGKKTNITDSSDDSSSPEDNNSKNSSGTSYCERALSRNRTNVKMLRVSRNRKNSRNSKWRTKARTRSSSASDEDKAENEREQQSRKGVPKIRHGHKAKSKNPSIRKFEHDSEKTVFNDVLESITKIGDNCFIEGSTALRLPEEEFQLISVSKTSSNIGQLRKPIVDIKSGIDTTPKVSRKAEYKWQVQNKDGIWITYGTTNLGGDRLTATSATSDQIERYYNNNLDAVPPVTVKSVQHEYVLDFQTMTQTNRRNLSQKPIRRIQKTPDEHSSITQNDIKKIPTGNYEWQFMDENGSWIKYGEPNSVGDHSTATVTSSDSIENHFQDNPTSNLQILSSKHTYVLDFQKMSQTNQVTSVQRNIRRVQKTNLTSLSLGNKIERSKILTSERDRIPVNAAANSVHDGNGAPPTAANVWQFEDESGAWITYGLHISTGDISRLSTTTSDDIEKYYNGNPVHGVMYAKSQLHQYILNFKNMTQTNQKTSKQRRIRRIPNQNQANNVMPSHSSQSNPVKKKHVLTNVNYEWFFLDENKCWIKYGQASSANNSQFVTKVSSDDIEKHYLQDSNSNLEIESAHHKYILDFIKMTQTNKVTRVERPIDRKAKTTGANGSDGSSSPVSSICSHLLPSKWTPMESKTSWTNVLLRSSDDEYTRLAATFQQALPNYAIKNIYRVQNEYIWKAYINRREYLKQQYPGIKYKEEVLYHGTDPGNVASICRENVDWRLHGTNNGQTFGRGSYFTNSPKLSASYSTSQTTNSQPKQKNPTPTAGTTPTQSSGTNTSPSAAQVSSNTWYTGLNQTAARLIQPLYDQLQSTSTPRPSKVMFVVKVLVGHVMAGNSTIVKPPKDGSGLPYDTTVDNVINPTIFVKYDSQEYYPEYYIEFD